MQFGRTLECRFFDLGANHLDAEFVVTDHSVIEDLLRLAFAIGHCDFDFSNVLALLDLVFKDDLLRGTEKLQDGEQVTVGAGVLIDCFLDTRAEHLFEVRARDPARRNVVTVRFCSELRIKRQSDLALADQIVKRTPAIFHPLTVVINANQTLQSNAAGTRCHAACFTGLAVGADGGIFPFDARITANTFFTRAGCGSIHRLLVGAGLNTFAISLASLLVDQNDTVLWAFINCTAWARTEATGISAVVA